MAVGGNSLYIKRDQEAVAPVPHSGNQTNIATGTFIGYNPTGNAVPALANSGVAQTMAVGFALMGWYHGTFTNNRTTRFDALDNPLGYGKFSSGAYTIGVPVYLSGTAPINYGTVPPKNAGDMLQTVGWVVPDRNNTGTWFRIHIGTPMRVLSGALLSPWNGPGTL